MFCNKHNYIKGEKSNMKKFTDYKNSSNKWFTILFVILFLVVKQEVQAQYVKNNGAYISISNNTVIGIDTLQNNSASILNNNGTFNLSNINNDGVILGNGAYNLTGNFTSTGTFSSESGTVDMKGTSAQKMDMAVTTFNNLTINNAAAVTFISTQTTITNRLKINSGKTFKIEADKNLTVTGVIDNFAGTSGFILKSNASGTASLIHNTDNVPITAQRYISGVSEDWHFLSAPVADQEISGTWNPSGTYGNGTGYDLYIYNEPTPCWTYQLNTSVAPTWESIHPTSNFVKSRGYLYATQDTNPTKEFIGFLNNGIISYPITNESPDLVVKGFNLVGNPYPSSIDWKSSTGWSRTNLVPSGGGYDVWIWNPASNNYGVYNSNGNEGTNGVTQYISPTQGYFVRAESNGNLGTTNDVRVNTGASNWLKAENRKTNSLKINITSQEGNGSDEVLLQFGFEENEAGALKFFSQNEEAPSLYLNDLDKDLSIRYFTNTNENSKIPLHFKAGQNGNYALTFPTESATFKTFLLEDKKTSIVTDLKVNATYEFNGLTTDAADRFVLHFKDITEESESLPASIYYDGNEINVDLTLVDKETAIKIYDVLGRLILAEKGAGNKIHRFKIQPKNAIYIIIASSNGKINRRLVLVH